MVLMRNPGSSKTGDTWILSLTNSYGVTYFVNEEIGGLGYDNNGNGNMSDIVWSPLFAEGTARAGTVKIQ